MTTSIFGEGFRHRVALAANHIPVMPYMNWSDSEFPYLGPLAQPVWHDPDATAQAFNDQWHANGPRAKRRMDAGGDCFRRLFAELSPKMLYRGLTTGVFPCGEEIRRWGTIAPAMLRANAVPEEFYIDLEPAYFPQAKVGDDGENLNIVQAVDALRRFNNWTDNPADNKEMFRLQQVAQVNTIRTVLDASGFAGIPFAVEGIANCTQFNGNVLPVKCPVNFISCALIPPGYTTWPETWVYLEQCLQNIARASSGAPTTVLLAATMPPDEAANGITLARRYGASVQVWADNCTDEATMAPSIQAFAAGAWGSDTRA